MKGVFAMLIRPIRFSAFIGSYPVVFAIFLAQCLLFAAMRLPVLPTQTLYEALSGVNLYIAQGEIWRLVSPVFVHIDFSHLLLNSFSLLLLGPCLERLAGKWKFILLYLGCGCCANLASFFLLPLTYSHAGASGALFGLIGAYVALVWVGEDIPKTSRQTILSIAVISVVTAMMQPGANHTAHLSGLVAGMLLGGMLLQRKAASPA